MKAGFFKQIITPPLGQIAFAGYTGRNRFPEATFSDIHARALVLLPTDKRKDAIVLISTELFMLRKPITDRIKESIWELMHIPSSNVVIHTIHSHQGPDTVGFYKPGHDFDPTHLDEAWIAHLIRQIVGIVYGALHSIFECKIGFGEGFLDRVTYNRREAALPNRPPKFPRTIDPSIGIIRIDDKQGNPRIVLLSYSTHPTFLQLMDEWSAEHIPLIEQALIEKLGKNIELIYFTAQAGDINPAFLYPFIPKIEILFNPTHALKKRQLSVDVESDSFWLTIKKFHWFCISNFIENPEDLINQVRRYLRTEVEWNKQEDVLRISKKGNLLGSCDDSSDTSLDDFAIKSALQRYLVRDYSIMNARKFAELFASAVKESFFSIPTKEYSNPEENQELFKIVQGECFISIDDPDMIEQFLPILEKSPYKKNEDGTISLPTLIQTIKLDRSLILCWPSEPINEIGLRIKTIIKNSGKVEHVYFFELCNDTFGYILTPFEVEAGGYEATVFTFGKNNSPILEQKTIELCSHLLNVNLKWEENIPLPYYHEAHLLK